MQYASSMKKPLLYFFILLFASAMAVSCQKEIDGLNDGAVNPADVKPKVGTVWYYRYEWYNTPGGSISSKTIRHKAVSEETMGGETWLKIVDLEPDTVVYYLNTKNDGLYQYTNNSPNLLCKHPATVNDTYTTFNTGTTEIFTVKGVNDTTGSGIGNIPLTRYEGVKPGNSNIIDVIWYNKNSWITWQWLYKLHPVPPNPPLYALYSRMHIENIVY